MSFALYLKIVAAILLLLLGIIIGLGFDEFCHRLIQWIPGFKEKVVLEKTVLDSNPLLLLQKLQTNPSLQKSWKFPEVLLILQNHYIKNQDKLQETFLYGEKNFSSSALYAFWQIRWAKKLYDSGYTQQALQIYDKEHPDNFWIEPELLKQKGLWAYGEGQEIKAYELWKTLEQKFPFSKAFREIKKEYYILKKNKE